MIFVDNNIIKLPKGFFSIPRKIITAEEAMKDVIPVNWDDILKDWKDSDKQAIELVKR